MRFDLPDDKTLTFEMTLPMRWGDMDAMGHVNNTVYFRYMETVRIDWLGAAGFPPNPAGEGPVIVNAFCTFMRQLEYPGDVLLRHYVGRPGTSSLPTYVTMARADDPQRIDAAGGALMVWTDFAAQKSRPLPDGVRARLTRPWTRR